MRLRGQERIQNPSHLTAATRRSGAAGLELQWEAPSLEIRRGHFRKFGFMPRVNAIVTGKRTRVEPSFLDQACQRWASKTKS